MEPQPESVASAKLQQLQLHGLQDVLSAKSLAAKVFWASILLGLAIGCTMNLTKVLIEFFRDPTSTSVDIKIAPELPIPAVVVCPVSALDITKIKTDYPEDWQQILSTTESVIAAATPMRAARSMSQGTAAPREAKSFSVRQFEQLMENVTHDPCEVIPLASRGNRRLNCSNIVEQLLDRTYGTCYKIDSGESQHSSADIEPVEMWITLPPIPDIVREPHPAESIVNFLGPKLMVGSAFPNDYAARLLQPGSLTQIVLSWGKTVLSPASSTPCLDDKETTALQYKSVKIGGQETCYGYNTARCIVERVSRMSWETCGCLPMGGRNIYTEWAMNQTVCTTEVLQKCPEILTWPTTKALKCGVRCTNWDQKIETSEVMLDDFAYRRYRRTGRNLTDGSQLLVISIRFSNTVIHELKQTNAITFPNMVGTVGGILGLWLGASMFTLLQIMSYLFALVKDGIRRCGRDRGKKVAPAEIGPSTIADVDTDHKK